MFNERIYARLRMAALIAAACACCGCGASRAGLNGGEGAALKSESGAESGAGAGVGAQSAPGEMPASGAAADGDKAGQDIPPDMFSGNHVVWYGKTYRRNTYVKTILIIGTDKAGELDQTTHGLSASADCVFLAVHDTARDTFRILMIPRDTMTEVSMTDLSGNELGKNLDHLLMAYAYGDGQEESCRYVADAVSGLLKGLPVDYYAAVNLDVIAQANDAVGGVTVTVPTEGMEGQDPAFVKGATLTLNGEQAEKFVHYRDIERNNSALYRMDQHQEYLKGFFEAVKATSKEKPGIVEELYGIAQGHMLTDMSKDQILKMGMAALKMDEFGDGDIFTLPGYGVAGGLYDEFFVEEGEMVPLILQLYYREA